MNIFLVLFIIITTINANLNNEYNKDTMTSRTVSQVLYAMERPEGVGAIVRRSIGTMQKKKFSPFLMLDHFNVDQGGFPEHPHLGQETISYMINGAMAHEDFTGSKGILYPGDLQFMTAGRGIVHSEMPVTLKNGEIPNGMQLWVDLPEELKETKPRYRDLRGYEIPVATDQDGKLKVKVISGKSYGVESLQDLAYSPVHYYHYFLKPGAKFIQDFPRNFNVFLYNMVGDGLKLSDGSTVDKFHNAFFNVDGDRISGENPSDSNNDIEFVLVGGEILDQRTVHHGPFVAKDQERIRRAFQDYSYARNGFENLRTWQSLISGGVTDSMIENELDGNWEKRKEAEKAYLAKMKNSLNDDIKDEL